MGRVLMVIPAFNEGRRIGVLLQKLHEYQKDILVFDDGSGDDTAEVADQAGFRVSRYDQNQGLSRIYRDAFSYARSNGYSHILSLDADGQHDPDYIPGFLAALKEYDFISGKRFTDPDTIPQSKIASNLFAILLIGEVIHKNLPDVSCGFRGWKVDIFPEEVTLFSGLYEKCRFGIVYKMLIESVLTGHRSGFVTIPAIYHPEVRLNTKTSEIVGLLKTVLSYKSIPSVEELLEKVSSGREAGIELNGIQFRLNPDGNDSFIFRTDHESAVQFFKSFTSEQVGEG